MGAVHARPKLQPLLPYARQFYAASSKYAWCDETARTPSLWAKAVNVAIRCCPRFTLLAEHEALCYLQSQLQDGEAVFAFLDDTFIVAAPGRVSRALLRCSRVISRVRCGPGTYRLQ